MKIKLIWAQSRGGVIALNGQMPWHLPEDLAYFKRTTLGQPVIMGRKTWDSLPPKFRPLPGRANIVVTRDATWAHQNTQFMNQKTLWSADSLDQALSICESFDAETCWVMGGGQMYAQAMALADELVVTDIDAVFDGDTFAPTIDATWVEVSRNELVSASGMRLAWLRYRRAIE